MALSGMAQVCARYWLAQGPAIPRDEAARLVAALSWRGLGGFPKADRPGRRHGCRCGRREGSAPAAG